LISSRRSSASTAVSDQNARTMREEDKLKLRDVLSVRSLYETLRLIVMLKSSR
jgi:hypothetical protein